MAIKKVKQLMEDLQNDTHVVLASNVAIADTATLATSSGKAGTAQVAVLASSANYAGTSLKATSSGYAGTSFVAIHGTSGTSIIA